MSHSFRAVFERLSSSLTLLGPGLAVAGLTAITAQFLSEHYGAPAMLMALLLGMALNFLSEEHTRSRKGVEFAARTVLRAGVALLGARISIEMVNEVGWSLLAVILFGVISTIGVGLLGARALGRRWSFGLLTGGAVAICGASAAMAIAAALPARERDERDLLFTVLSVTLLSTVAMIAYPMLVAMLQLTPKAAGVFLGGTIHDVAQVVGAGFSVGRETGEIATLVKLVRVATLAPVVLAVGMALNSRRSGTGTSGKAQPILPGFVVGFLILAAVNSIYGFTQQIADIASLLSRGALLTAIAAVGMKTSLRSVFEIGGGAIALIVIETLFLAGFVLVALHFIQ